MIKIRLNELETAGEKPIKVSDSHVFYGHKAQPRVLYQPDFHAAKAGECPSTTVAVAVEGKRVGGKLYVCTNKKCPTHSPYSVGLSPEEKAQGKKRAQEQRIQQEYRKRLLEEIYKRVPAQLSHHELNFVALRYLDQAGHDNQRQIFKFFQWEEKKDKSGYGDVDYGKLTSAKLDGMTSAELGKFLMVCALASDLYFSPYLTSGGNLAKEAEHYRVHAENPSRSEGEIRRQAIQSKAEIADVCKKQGGK